MMDHTKQTTGKKVLAVFLHFLKIAIAAALIWWVVKDIQLKDLEGIPKSRLILAYLSAFLMIFLQSFFTAWRWQILVKAQGIPITFFRAFSLTFQGTFFSLCLPGGAVGGDVIKAAFIVKETSADKKIEGVTSIFADRLVGMIGLFGMADILVLLSLPRILSFDHALRITVLTLSAVCFAGVAAAFFMIFHDIFLRIGFIRAIVDFTDRIAKGKIRRILSSVDVYRKKWKTLLLTCIMGVTIIHPFLLLALFLIAVCITQEGQNFLNVSLASVIGNAASCIPGTIGGLGARDKLMQLLLETSGISKSNAGIIPILYTLGYVSVSLTGAVFFVADSFLKRKQQTSE